jgi:hypothetical protein
LAFPVLLRDQPEGQPISYDDYYFFEQLYQTTELGNSYTYPGIFSFYGPGPDNQTTRGVIKIADTTDSVANPAPRVNAQIDWIGPITATDLFYSTYVGMMGSNQLGLYGGEFGPGATGCVIGTEGVGTVTPRDATGPITLKRIITSMACFASENGVTPIPCPNVTGPLPADDTGDKITTDPQLQTPRGPAGGQVFNMDVPGITYDTTQPIITSDIIRVRYNFVTYAVDSDGKTVISQKVPYFVRLSCRFFNGTANLVPVNVVDNSINLGTTPITWNLQ